MFHENDERRRAAARSRPGALLLAAACAALAASCGARGPQLYPVTGSVVFGKTAPEGATVVLRPVGGGPMPSGRVEADGKFTLHTHPHGAGAPAGEYVVLITWYPADAREQDNPRNQLPPKYATAEKTPLPKVTIKEGPNELGPFRLSR